MRKKFLKFKKGGFRGEKGNKLFYFLLSFIITYGTAFVSGSIASVLGENTYEKLIKPFFSPPSIVFPIVWNILFALMSYALYRIWKDVKTNPENKKAVKIYLISLFFNFLWTPLFFGLRLRFIAFIDVIILWITIILTILEFRKREKVSAILLVPYLLWVTFAGVLNFAIWYLNA